MWLGHESRHDPILHPNALCHQFEQDSIIRHPLSVRVSQRGLVNTRSSLGMMTLDFDPKGQRGVEKLVEVFLVQIWPEKRVPVHAGSQGLQFVESLVGNGLSSLGELKVLPKRKGQCCESQSCSTGRRISTREV